jgi:cytochrome d ubiquinol oxidase subunit I
MGIYYINRLINRGPQGRAIEPSGHHTPNRPLAAAHEAAREAMQPGS